MNWFDPHGRLGEIVGMADPDAAHEPNVDDGSELRNLIGGPYVRGHNKERAWLVGMIKAAEADAMVDALKQLHADVKHEEIMQELSDLGQEMEAQPNIFDRNPVLHPSTHHDDESVTKAFGKR